MVFCIECGSKREPSSKAYCQQCWKKEQHARKDKNIVICIRCNKSQKHYAKGYCKDCYHKEFYKEHHARYERNRRKNRREEVIQMERKRSATEHRKEWRRKYNKQYYEKNKDKLLEYQKNYRRSDYERQNNYKRRRIARVKSLEDTLTVEEWNNILEKYNYSCAYCGISDVPLEREHKIPAARGGGYTFENIVPSCGSCNRKKKTMTDEEFREYIKKYG